MRERDLVTLGFHRVREELARFAASVPGKEACLQTAPRVDRDDVERELERTESCARLIRDGRPPPQPAFADIRPWLRAASREGFVLDGPALVEIRRVLRGARAAARFFPSAAGAAPALADYTARLRPIPLLHEPLERMLEETGQVRDEASDELRSVRQTVRSLRHHISERLEALLSERGVAEALSDQFVTVRNDRYVIPVRAGAAARVPGVVQDRSVSGETLFVEPFFAVELNNELLLAVKEEERIVRRILGDLSDLVRVERAAVAALFEALVELDVLVARARLAVRYRCVRPESAEDGTIDLREARHPGLLFSGRPVVPVDLCLPAKQGGLVITGPNTGGKTVALKTLGLCAAMAQSGLLVPAAEGARLPCFRVILVDMGDEQDVERNLSTFSAHLANLSDMFRQRLEGALVLLDEPGVGTDPDEGAALAIGLLEALRRRGARVAVTTHYTPVKVHALQDPAYAVAAVDFDIETMTPRYRLRQGSLGSSLGLAVARRLGLPADVLERAEAAAGPDGLQLRSVLEEVERLRRALEAATEQAQAREREAESRLHSLKRLEAEAREQRRRAWNEAAREARACIEETEREARRLLRQLAAGAAERGAVRRFLRERRAAFASRAAPDAEAEPRTAALVPGSPVELLGSDLRGELVAVEGERAWVRRGSMRFEVPVARLRAAPPETGARVRVRVSAPGDVPGELSLLGLRVPDALARLDRFLDRACRAGLPQVRVVHGVGSGALCRAVREHLQSSPYCVEVRPAPSEEGGDRATIAILAG